jgi:hypothetical protein
VCDVLLVDYLLVVVVQGLGQGVHGRRVSPADLDLRLLPIDVVLAESRTAWLIAVITSPLLQVPAA